MFKNKKIKIEQPAEVAEIPKVFRDKYGKSEEAKPHSKQIASKKENAFLLESVELGERLGRFSFIGTDPDAILEYSRGSCHLIKKGRRKTFKDQKDPLHIIERIMECYRYVPDQTLPKFTGGFVGYIGYELVSQFEDIKLKTKPGLNFPDAVLFFARNLIAFDHIKHHLKIIHLAHVDRKPERIYQNAIMQLKKIGWKIAYTQRFEKKC